MIKIIKRNLKVLYCYTKNKKYKIEANKVNYKILQIYQPQIQISYSHIGFIAFTMSFVFQFKNKNLQYNIKNILKNE
jgi:hypothetical protein